MLPEPEQKPKKKPRKPSVSPTRLTLEHLRKTGHKPVAVVEHYNAWVKIRQDLFGFIDVIGGVPGGGTIAVQSCSGGRAAGDRGEDDAGRGSDVAARVAKIRSHPNLPDVLAMGWRVVVQSWRKNASGRWELREIPVTSPAPLPPTPFDGKDDGR